MPTSSSVRRAELAALVSAYLSERLNDKLQKLPSEDPKRTSLQQRFEQSNWLADAAKRASRLQQVTHTLKGVHSQARGTSLLVPIETLPTLDVVGSHCVGHGYELDVDGDAAALDVYAFLKIEYEGKTLLALSQVGDPDWAAVLSVDADTARDLMSAFAGLTQPREGLASHTLAKQVYWLIGPDPHDDAGYHLLAPLHPSSLIHSFYGQLQEDRFGGAAKAAREARREGRYVEQPQYFYPNLVS